MEEKNGGLDVIEKELTTPNATKARRTKKKNIAHTTKARTPSGQVISTSVKDIRNFFVDKVLPCDNLLFNAQSPMKSPKCTGSVDYTITGQTSDEWKVVKGVKSLRAQILDSEGKSKSKISEPNQNKRYEWRRENRFAHLKEDQSSIDSESDFEDLFYKEDVLNERSIVTPIPTPLKGIVPQTRTEMEPQNKQQNQDGNINSDSLTVLTEVIKEAALKGSSLQNNMNAEEDPQAIDVRTVVKMFHTLQIKMDQKHEKTDGGEIEKLKRELSQYKRRSEVMSGVVTKLGGMIEGISKKVDTIEMRNMRRHLVITGLKTSDAIGKCLKEIATFFMATLDVEVDIIDCFKLGKGPTKPIVIMVDSIASRATVYQSMEVYKTACIDNEVEQKVFINDYVPAEKKESRRREREIFRENEKDVNNQVPMTIDRTGLRVNGDIYKPMIKPPDPTKVLSYTEQQLDTIYEIDVQPGDPITQDGSSFVAYAVPVNSHLTVENTYMRLRLKHPRAKHIVCAYTIPGMPRFKHEEYCNDGEIGAGKMLMNLIKINQLTNIAIFVVRTQNGGNIGSVRFEMMKQAVSNVMAHKPYNKYTNSKQELKPQEELEEIGQYHLSKKTQNRQIRKQRLNNSHVRGWSTRPGGPRLRGRRPQQQPDGYTESNKRRRHDSSNTNIFTFDQPTDARNRFEAFTAPENEGLAHYSELGASWPTLHQSNPR